MAATRIDWRKLAATACLKVDWSQFVVAALGSPALAKLVIDSLHQIGRKLETDASTSQATPPRPEQDASETASPSPTDDPPASVENTRSAERETTENATHAFVDPKVIRAASLLGIDVSANEDVIRAALRARLSSSRLHPDHGGDGQEATSLIAAKNFLIERAKVMRM